MTHRLHPIAVTKLPQSPTLRQESHFLSALQGCLNTDRPRIVLDCSEVTLMDRPTLQLMLCCLEEAMKRNGDVKLAALAPAPRTILDQTGAGKLFEFFSSVEESVHSFRRVQANAYVMLDAAEVLRPSETAA